MRILVYVLISWLATLESPRSQTSFPKDCSFRMIHRRVDTDKDWRVRRKKYKTWGNIPIGKNKSIPVPLPDGIHLVAEFVGGLSESPHNGICKPNNTHDPCQFWFAGSIKLLESAREYSDVWKVSAHAI